MIRSAKNNYNKELLKENANDANKFWKCIKRIYPCHNKNESGSITSFTINDVKTNSNSKIANGFCTYFTSVVHLLKAETFKLRKFIWKKHSSIPLRTNKKFKFQYVSKIEIEHQLK